MGLYTCGPTVYRFVHIGNLRTYLMADWLRRTLDGLGYEVTHVKNITDVGHMRQEYGGARRGQDDRRRAGRGQDARRDRRLLHRRFPCATRPPWASCRPMSFPRATDHVPEMVALTERLLRPWPRLRGRRQRLL